ncbi:KGG domain-containing protein [Stenotrophomonas maltophilia]|uniref:General stress protein n=1 Tax=Stenotrophomonas maltophilia TaxID=40324 RepID=A0AAP7GUA3_STEMA|nr:KGG domain-containing protein [Stenotrophomonas maltophilia]OBU63019.1 general stress protein [Stenotrophomonas maltophilia]
MANQNQNQGNSNRGFASMDEDKQRDIAAKGGRAAHESGNAHELSPEEAREAGRKGGESVSQDRQHMADIGREGGQASRGGGNRGDGQQQQQQQRGGNNRGGQQR